MRDEDLSSRVNLLQKTQTGLIYTKLGGLEEENTIKECEEFSTI